MSVDIPAPSLRERILSAAFAAFMEQGYAGTSTLDIATRAKVSKRDLYAQFGSKQAMLSACIGERAARMRVPLNLAAPHDRASLVGMLTRFGATLVLEVSRPEVLAVYRLAIQEAERAPDVARTLDELGRANTLTALSRLVAASQAANLIGAGKPEEIADRFTALLWGTNRLVRLLLRVTDPPDAAEAEHLASAATSALLKLYPPPATQP